MGQLSIHVFLFCTIICTSFGAYHYQTEWFEVPLDHFSFNTNQTFKIRYLLNEDFWNKTGGGPIFFYTGNEGKVETFAQNTGLMWELAPKFQAAVIFAEHRYYGQSMPFGKDSYSSIGNLGYLTSEQALADYAQLLLSFRAKERAHRSPIIAFGGSYGGMLAAWMRLKYPHVIQGSIAASAPVALSDTPCNRFAQIVSTDFLSASQDCYLTIRKSWDVINNMAATDGGKEWLSNTFRLCQPLKTTDNVTTFKLWVGSVYGYIAMVDYPYENSFLYPVPANPVKAVCNVLASPRDSDKILLQSIFKGVSIYYNYTGQQQCLDYTKDPSGDLDVGSGWDFQACTEMVTPFCADGINDMFEPFDWNFTDFSNLCFNKWGVRPKNDTIRLLYGSRDIRGTSNIVLSNGLLDPWYGSSILYKVSDSILAVVIPEGAHHLDLRASNAADPRSVISARQVESDQIKRWIDQFHRLP